LLFLSLNFYNAYKNVEQEKDRLGYKTMLKNPPPDLFKRGAWLGMLIAADLTSADGAHNLLPFDVDDDGKIELVGSSYRSDALMLFRYKGDPLNIKSWSKYIIDSSVGGGIPERPVFRFIKSWLRVKVLGAYLGGAHYTAISDLNGDGRKDLVVAADLKKNDIVWYEAPEYWMKGAEWKKHVIYNNDSHRTYQIETGDIDGDGNQDIVLATKTDNSLGWLRNNSPSSQWLLTWIDNNCQRCFNARVADVDKNGRSDIIASEDDAEHGGKLHFYEYINNPEFRENWHDHIIGKFSPGQGVSVFRLVDIDNDQDLDIVAASHQGRIYILENPFPNNIFNEWPRYQINDFKSGRNHDFREIDVGDIDGDGDLDVVAADEGGNMVFWFENSGPAFSGKWKEHIIDASDNYLKWCHSVALGDIDGDGDLDVAVAAAGSNDFIIYFNNLIKPQ